MAKRSNKEILTSIIVDCQHLTMQHRSQAARGKRLTKDIAQLCKNFDIEITEEEIREMLYW